MKIRKKDIYGYTEIEFSLEEYSDLFILEPSKANYLLGVLQSIGGGYLPLLNEKQVTKNNHETNH